MDDNIARLGQLTQGSAQQLIQMGNKNALLLTAVGDCGDLHVEIGAGLR